MSLIGVALLAHLRPVTPVLGDEQVEVRLRGDLVTQFTVAAGEDSQATARPGLGHIEVTSGYFRGLSCGSESDLTVSTTGDHDLVVLADRDANITVMPVNILGISAGTSVETMSLAAGGHALQVFAVDVAENLSEPAPLPELTVPAEQVGCNATGVRGGRWLPAALLGLAGRRRRRRSFAGTETMP